MANPASESVTGANGRLREQLPFDDRRDFEDTDRGFLGSISPGVVHADDGHVAWDADAYAFVDGDAPDTVNPSLWRQSQLVAKHGLYEVVEGIYQVRGFDLSNVTFVEGDTGLIVIDPLISTETAAAALGLYRQHRGERPVVAVIYSHSHVDHFGGVFGVASVGRRRSRQDPGARARGIRRARRLRERLRRHGDGAPRGLHVRRGTREGAAGQVGAGLGQTTSSGEVGLIVPTRYISTTGETHTIDGVEIEFQMAPGTEAPAEMHFYFPRYRALCMAENATHTLHNLVTLRGALVRDPHVWATYLTEAIETFGDRADVAFASHHWPTWGSDRIIEFLSTQRDLYAYLHDQTLRLLNQGLTGAEIAEVIELPPALERAWNARGYYGSVSHNVKAIYQRYLGWFDGNPARLWPHPPAALAARYVKALGGVDAVVGIAQTAFDEGDYRWAATLLDHAVFDSPDHQGARTLYADTLEQLGYGAENGTWRNFFLSGATELREGNFGTPTATSAPALVAQLSPTQLLDAIAISVDGPKAWDLDLAFDLTFTDLDVNYRVTVRNGVLVYVERPAADDAALTMRLTKARMIAMLGGDADGPGVDLAGDAGVLQSLLGVLDRGDPSFEIVLP